MNAFVRRAHKLRGLVDRLTSDFRETDFFGLLASATFGLLPSHAPDRLLQLSLETVIQSVEICPGLVGSVTGEFLFAVVARIDALCGSRDDGTAQLLFQGVSRAFDLLTLHDPQCRVLKHLVGQLVARLFDCGLQSVQLVLILSKALAHVGSANVP